MAIVDEAQLEVPVASPSHAPKEAELKKDSASQVELPKPEHMFRVDLIYHSLKYGQQMEEELKVKEGVLNVRGRQRTRHNYQVTIRASKAFVEQTIMQNFKTLVEHEYFVLVAVSDESKVEIREMVKK